MNRMKVPKNNTVLSRVSEEQCYFIAEIGLNHNGDLREAKTLIDAAHKAGVDAVKFQIREDPCKYESRELSGEIVSTI